MSKEFTLTVRDVLKRPLFQDAEILAGHQGLSRSIRWVHILETPEGYSFLNGGELILSTASGFGEDRTKRLSYLLELMNRHAAGLCIEMGSYLSQIPQDMKDLADNHGFPLIAFKRPVHFVNITMDLHETITYRHINAMRNLETYARDIQKLTFETPSITKLLSHFQKVVDIQSFYFDLDHSPLFIPSMSEKMKEEVTNVLQTALASNDFAEENKGILILDRKKIFFLPIMAMGHALSYIGVILDEHEEPDHFLTLSLDYTATAVGQILLRKMFAQERFLDNQQRLLDDILDHKIQNEEQVQTLLGIKKNEGCPPSYLSVIVEINNRINHYDQQTDSPFHDLIGIFRAVLVRCGFQALIRGKGNRLYLLLIENNRNLNIRKQSRKAIHEIEQSCRKALGEELSYRLGVGRASKSYSQAHLHFQEAEQVLTLYSELNDPFFENLGVYRILLQPSNGFVLNSFITDYLGPLLEHDKKYNSELLLTLKVFLQSGSKQEAAERLYIRRQTLYQRLEKIEEILGKTYLTHQNCLCLELAIYAYELMEQRKAKSTY